MKRIDAYAPYAQNGHAAQTPSRRDPLVDIHRRGWVVIHGEDYGIVLASIRSVGIKIRAARCRPNLVAVVQSQRKRKSAPANFAQQYLKIK